MMLQNALRGVPNEDTMRNSPSIEPEREVWNIINEAFAKLAELRHQSMKSG